ncbi:MAG TPA: IS4 family transposase [Acidimicrobiales bacterium]
MRPFGGHHGCHHRSGLGSKNFATVELGDARRTRRLIDSAARIAAAPRRPFNQVFDWNDLRGFYRLCHADTATVDALQHTHRDLTRQAMADHPVVLVLHDTTEIDLTSHTAVTGLGPIGDGNGRGFLQHNSLAVVPDTRHVLGLAHQQLRLRTPAPADDTSARRKHRTRESELWTAGIRAVGRPPEGVRWVDVGDRGADDYEAMRASREAGHDFLFRVCQDRQGWSDEARTQPIHVLDVARNLSGSAVDAVAIPARGGRPGREAKVSLAASRVWLPAPEGTANRAGCPVIPGWVVRVWEANPPAGVEPLEWVLVTSVPTVTAEELTERRDWYACRWLVEVFHDIEKNGCRVEGRRFETADRMAACLAILSVVAVRVFQLRTALDHQPGAGAEAVASGEEVAVLGEALGVPVATVKDFVRGVARLGGFLGRKHDGDPGVETLWRGYHRLQDFILGYRCRAKLGKKDVGNR